MVSLVAISCLDVVDRGQHHVDHAAANSISSSEFWRLDDSLWHSHIDRGKPVVFGAGILRAVHRINGPEKSPLTKRIQKCAEYRLW